MVFSTNVFIFYFLPLVLGIYLFLPWCLGRWGLQAETLGRVRNGLLLAASYVFYGWWNPWFVLLMFAVTVVNYSLGLRISRPGAGDRERRLAMAAAVIVSLGVLGFFKYAMFFQSNLNSILALIGWRTTPVLEILLPVGISFYVFQALTYSIDVYRREAHAARSFGDFACYIALYPQLVAGPIVRYGTVAEQLVARNHTWERFASGTALFILGLAKKVLLANPMGDVADAAFDARSIGAPDAWLGVTAYAFQIYFDFSGYSDMAVGLGRMIGFEFLKNFDAPYHADSITDFWRRWHISLSTFLRDYLYIPLGGNRKGLRRTYVNLAVVMLLGGLWHGAAWNFVAWGASHGLLLALERSRGKKSFYGRLPRLARVALTFVVVLFTWVLFRASDLSEAGNYLLAMLGGGGGDTAHLLRGEMFSQGRVLLLALSAVFVAQSVQAHDWCDRITPGKAVFLLGAFFLALAALFSQSANPFLYFQF